MGEKHVVPLVRALWSLLHSIIVMFKKGSWGLFCLFARLFFACMFSRARRKSPGVHGQVRGEFSARSHTVNAVLCLVPYQIS